jgi:LysR family glycine cleavage system transcriptional activator
MPSINLNALRMFEVTSRHLNFRLAAKELHLTQGAVAQQVRGLESALDVALFHRLPRGLALTDSGKEYQQQVQRAFRIIDTATAKLLKKNNRVTLSVTPSFASKWLVPRLGKFADTYPDIDLNIIASGKLSNLYTDGIDIAIRITKAPFPIELEVVEFSAIDLCAVCSIDFSLSLNTINGAKDFHKQPLIQDGHFHWNHILEKNGENNNFKILQFNQTSLAIDAAINGQGIALSPQILVNKDIADGKLLSVWHAQRDITGNAYYLLSSKSEVQNPLRSKVIDWLLNEINQDL